MVVDGRGGGGIAVYRWRTKTIGSVDGSSVDCIIAV